jgi:hypothetical protein
VEGVHGECRAGGPLSGCASESSPGKLAAGGQWIDNFAAAGTDWSRDKGVVTPGAGPYMHEDVG